MPNEIKHIKSKPTNLTGPNAARQQVSLNREQDSKPSKKAGDGAMTFMVWSIAGTVIAACSSPIFSDVADLTGGGGGGDAQGGPGGVGALTNGRISGADISVVNENGVSGADVGHSDEAGNIILDDGADLEIGAQYDADLSVPGAREISTGEGVSGTLRSLPYSGGDLVISPLTDLLAKARNDATDQEVIDAGGADGFYQGVLDSIYGESIVTVADVLNRYHYNPLVTDDAVTQLVSQGATALSEIQEQDRTTPNADRIVTLQELFSGYRDNIADGDATNDAMVVLSNSGTIDEGVEGRIAAAVARGGLPVVATPNGGEAIQMTEDQDLPLVSGNAELLFGFQDPFGNSDSPDDEDDAREDGQLVGIYIQAASVDGNIDVMFRDNDRGIVGLASVQGADRGVVTSTPAPHNNTFFYVSAENFGQLILSPDANFNTENRPNPQIRFYVYDGEDVTPETGIGMLEIEVAAENDAPEITSQTTPAPITSNAGSASGTFQVSDADGDTDFTWSATGPTTYGTLEFNNAMSGNGAWTFTLNAEAFDGIADGENVPVTFNITATDLSGGVSEPVSVVIMLQGQNVPTTGTNVAPTDIQATLDGASEAVADNALVATYDGNAPTADMVVATLMTSDDDTGDTHMYSITGADMNSFRINGNQLLFASGVTEADNRNPGSTWSVDITSRDSGGLDVTQTFTIERAGNAFPVFDTEASTDYDATNSRFTKDVTDDNMNPDPDMDSPTATGTIVATDADGGTVTLSARQSGGTEDLGNVGFNGNVWTFALLPAGVIALNALGGGATEILTFEITASDGSGTDTATLRIRLVGATDDSIDEPDIDTPNSGLVGTIMDDDASAHDNTPTPAAMGAITLTPGTDISGLMWSVASASVSGLPAGVAENTDFGTLTLPGSAFTSFDAQFAGDAGTPRSLNWVFTPTDAINALRTTDTGVTITYEITASNSGGDDAGSIATLVINLDGVNDTPELAEVVTDGAVTEAGGTDNNTAGDVMANGSFTITDPDVGHDDFAFAGNTLEGRSGTSGAYETDGSIDGTYGTLTLNNSTGAWTYALRDDDPDTQALDVGDTAEDVFNIRLVNADGADIKRSEVVTLTIGVTGADDALVFGTNNFDPVVVTNDSRTATGTFSASDPDDEITWSATPTANGNLGTVGFVNNAWTFTLTADGVTALEGLASGATTDITFDITANDEDAGGDLTITLTGPTAVANMPPVIVTGSGIFSTGLTIEDPSNAPTDDPMAVVSTNITRFTANDPDGDNNDITWAPATPLQGSPLVATGTIDVSNVTVATLDRAYTAADFGALTVNTDGTWSFDPTDAINVLDSNDYVLLNYEIQATDDGGATDTETLTVRLNGETNAAGGLMVTNEAVRAFVVINGVEFRINTDSSATSSYEVEFNTTSADEYVAFTAPSITVYAAARDANHFSQGNIARIFNEAGLTGLDVAAIILEEDTTAFTIANWDADGDTGTENEYDFSPVTVTPTLDDAVTEDDATDETARGFLEVTGGTGSYTYTGGITTVIGTDPNEVTYQIFNGTYGQLIVDGDGNWTYVIDNTRQVTQDLSSGGSPVTDPFTVIVGETGSIRTVDHVITITVNGANEGVANIAPTLTPSAAAPDDGYYTVEEPGTDDGMSAGTLMVDDPDTTDTPASLTVIGVINGGATSFNTRPDPISSDDIQEITDAGQTFEGVYGNFVLTRDADSGAIGWDYQIDETLVATNALGEYDATDSTTFGTETLSLRVWDDEGLASTNIETISVQVRGADDAATITSPAGAFSPVTVMDPDRDVLTDNPAEPGRVYTGTFSATDPDDSMITWLATATANGNLGTVMFDSTTNSNEWVFRLEPAGVTALNVLAAGATTDITFTISANGVDADTPLTIRLMGAADTTIDAPVIATGGDATDTVTDTDARDHENTPGPETGTITATTTSPNNITWRIGNTVISGLTGDLAGRAATEFGGLTLTPNANGTSVTWEFTPTDAINDLSDGDTGVTITYTIAAAAGGEDATTTVTITLAGVTNAAPEIVTGSQFDPQMIIDDMADVSTNEPAAISGAFTATGTVTGWSYTMASFTGDIPAGRTAADFGSFTLNDNGEWTFDPTTVINDLGMGQSVIFEYTITADNAAGSSTSETFRITLTGTNDVPTITSTGGGQSLTDASADDHILDPSGPQTITGTAVASDVDATDGANDLTWSIAGGGAATTTYGTLVFDNSGVGGGWTFTTDPAAFNELTHGQSMPITYSVQAEDPQNGTSAAMDLTFTLVGVNDKPDLAVTETDVNVIEAGGANNAMAGDTAANGSLTITDPDTGHNQFTFAGNTLQGRAGTSGAFTNAGGAVIEGVYGDLTLMTDGTWAYELDNSDADTQGLRGALTNGDPAEMMTDVFNIRLENVDAGDTQTSDIETITITVTGADDATEITSLAGAFGPVDVMDPDRAVLTDNPTEPAAARVYTGTFSATDDDDSTITWSATATGDNSGLGTVTFDNPTDMNEWVFGLTPMGVEALNALDPGATTNITFNITATTDSGSITAPTPLTIRLMGAADNTIAAPEIDTNSVIIGTVTDTDARDHENTPSSASGTIMATTSSTNNITWNSSNMMIDGFTGRAASEFGSLALVPNANGTSVTWTFTPTDAINDLSDGDVGVTITYTIAATAGGHDATTTLTINLAGVTNDVPEIVTGSQFDPQMITDGMADVSTNEPAAISGAFTATGTVTGWSYTMASFTGDIPAGRTAADFGSFTLNDNGEWTFDPTTVINDLGMGQSVIFEYTITADNAAGSSTSETFRITLTGTNDVPTITSTGGGQSLTDASADDHILDPSGPQTITGTAVASDVDATDGANDLTWSIAGGGAATTTYGTLVFDNSGVGGGWTFTTDPAAFNELTHGQSMPITYSVQAEDPQNGTSAAMDLTFTLVGVNDKPDLAVTETDVNVIEAGGANNAMAGDTAANGSITITDPDTGHNVFTFAGNTLQGRAGTSGAFTNAGGAVIEGVYGDLTLMTDGTWAYELDNSDADTQGLRGALTNGDPAEMMTDVFNIRLENVDAGDTQTSDVVTLTINVTGANDDPVIVTDTGIFSTGITITDDNPIPTNDPDAVNQATVPMGGTAYGSFTATDVDTGDTITWSPAMAAQLGAPATGSIDVSNAATLTNSAARTAAQFGALTVNADGTWSFDPTTAINDIANNEHVVLSYDIVATDSSGGTDMETLTVRLNGVTNVRPPADAPDFSGASEATHTFTDGNSAPDNDFAVSATRSILVDNPDDLTWSVAEAVVDGDTTETDAAHFGAITFPSSSFVSFGAAFPGNSLSWAFDPNTRINDLNSGQSVTITYAVTATNHGGASSNIDLVITLEGLTNVIPNSAPTLTPPAGGHFVVEDSSTSMVNGTLTVGDPDLTDTVGSLTVIGVINDQANTLNTQPDAGMISSDADIYAITGALNQRLAGLYGDFVLTRNGNGAIDWRYEIDEARANSLDETETPTETLSLRVWDDEGLASSTETISVEVRGADDALMFDTNNFDPVVVLDPSTNAGDTPTETGTFSATDPDDEIVWEATTTDTTLGEVEFSSTTNGMWTFTLLPAGVTALNDLASGSTQDIIFDITANGMDAGGDLTIRLTGAAMEVTGLFAVPPATADTTGTSGVDMLDGTAAAETIQGGNDSDTITTGGGNDLVIGGHGIDTINLDSGAETIVYRFESDARTGDNAWQATDGGDVINNFRYGQDKLIFVDISDDTPITSLEEFIGDSDLPTFSTANINTMTGDIGSIQIFFPLAGTLDGTSGGTESGSAVVVNFDEGAGALFPSLADPVIGAAFAPNLTNLSILNVLFGGSDTFDAFDVVDASMLPAELAIL